MAPQPCESQASNTQQFAASHEEGRREDFRQSAFAIMVAVASSGLHPFRVGWATGDWSWGGGWEFFPSLQRPSMTVRKARCFPCLWVENMRFIPVFCNFPKNWSNPPIRS